MLVQKKAHDVIDEKVWSAFEHKADSELAVWIYFTDKQIFTPDDYHRQRMKTTSKLKGHTKSRRQKVMATDIVTFHDLPVSSQYIDQILGFGANYRSTSRWLNAVSVLMPSTMLGPISSLPFVRKITLVNHFKRTPVKVPTMLEKSTITIPHVLDYGASLAQLQEINVTAVHDLGYSGKGVIVGMLDTGFNRSHEALQHLDLLGEWDFINNDGSTKDEPGDPTGQHNHGTWTLSTLGGASAGNLYGPAYGASFLLAKTENVASETQIEEDFWVAGIEWAETNGADVISSSLGYLEWYTYEDMDGNTAVTTIAADLAAQRGVVVCTAAGNERQHAWHYMIAPADGDSVIACGAVDAHGVIASFSSSGPTFDGRIKPEVVARGIATVCASSYDSTGYTTKNGTSLSTPLIGGSAALLLEAHPQWTPMMVREALMMTADRAVNPDNLYGWGRIDVLAALQYRPKGDTNGDDVVNILDVILTLNIILDNYSPSASEAYAADANWDNQVDVNDITQIVTMILGDN